MKRRQFLSEFLGALGAEEIEWREETETEIAGKVIYKKDEEDEVQEFCWHVTEEGVPSKRVTELAKLLKEQQLLSIDQISVTREELRGKYNTEYELEMSDKEFTEILEKLEEVEVPMVDDGKETDAYFIHE